MRSLMSRNGRFTRKNKFSRRSPLFEPLENRQLMSLTIAVREANGASSATVSSVGQVLNLELVATITSANDSAAQDGLQDVSGSIVSTQSGSGAVAGNLAAKNVAPFNATGAAPGTIQDLNGDANLDVGTTSTKTTQGLFFARSSPVQTESSGTGTVSGGSLDFVIGNLTYTVTKLNSGASTTINFAPYVSTLPEAAAWLEEGKEVDNTNGIFSAASAFTVTGNSTVAPATPLKGTVIGTAGSYKNDGNTIAKAFDGNLSTFFDGPGATGNWAGLDLGSTYKITSVEYSPRSGWASRMVGGIFQGSNSATFASGVTNLATITATPATGVFSTLPVTSTSAFRYLRYLSPANSYGDVAELEFFGTAATTVTQRTGTVIGTSGSYQKDGNTIAKAVDGNLSTFFDGPTANGNWVGLDLGSAQTVSQISYAPRSGWASRMVGGIFQASNSANFSSGVVNLYTVTTAPTVGVLTTVTISPVSYRYYRYLSPSGSYGDVAEIEFAG